MEKTIFKTSRDIYMRNVLPKFQSSRLNGVAIIERTYTHTYIHVNTLEKIKPKNYLALKSIWTVVKTKDEKYMIIFRTACNEVYTFKL